MVYGVSGSLSNRTSTVWELVEQDFNSMTPSKKANVVKSQAVPFLETISHHAVRASLVLEQSVGTIYNVLFGKRDACCRLSQLHRRRFCSKQQRPSWSSAFGSLSACLLHDCGSQFDSLCSTTSAGAGSLRHTPPSLALLSIFAV